MTHGTTLWQTLRETLITLQFGHSDAGTRTQVFQQADGTIDIEKEEGSPVILLKSGEGGGKQQQQRTTRVGRARRPINTTARCSETVTG
jgi:hypothetical protein